jgi:hypothetical protein
LTPDPHQHGAFRAGGQGSAQSSAIAVQYRLRTSSSRGEPPRASAKATSPVTVPGTITARPPASA